MTEPKIKPCPLCAGTGWRLQAHAYVPCGHTQEAKASCQLCAGTGWHGSLVCVCARGVEPCE